MNKLCRIAKGLDVFFIIAYWICFIFAAVFLAIDIVLLFANKPIAQLGLDAFTYSYNGIQFHFSGEDANSFFFFENGRAAYFIALAMSVVGFVLALLAIRIIRKILKPMKECKPFEAGVSGKFRTLGIFAIIYGVISNLASLVGQQILLNALQGVKGQEFIVSVNRNFDLSFVLVAVMLFLCSYIFRYGEELQKQADETL